MVTHLVIISSVGADCATIFSLTRHWETTQQIYFRIVSLSLICPIRMITILQFCNLEPWLSKCFTERQTFAAPARVYLKKKPIKVYIIIIFWDPDFSFIKPQFASYLAHNKLFILKAQTTGPVGHYWCSGWNVFTRNDLVSSWKISELRHLIWACPCAA